MKESTHHWWMQRVTSAGLLPLTLFFLWNTGRIATTDRAALTEWLGNPFVSLSLALFSSFAFYHAALGVQVIIEDYVHDRKMNAALLLLNKVSCLLCGVLCLGSALYIGFGS